MTTLGQKLIAAATGTVSDISDAQLVERAMRNLKSAHGHKVARWVAVMDAFALGSTCAHQLCARFNMNPDDMISAR